LLKSFLSIILSALLFSFAFAKQVDQKIIASCKNHQITEEQLSDFYQNTNIFAAFNGKQFKELPSEVRKEILQIYLKRLVLEDAARESKIEKTEDYKKNFQLYSKFFLVQSFVEKKIQERLTDNAIEAAYKDLIKDLKDKGELRLQYLVFPSHEKALETSAKIKSGKSFAEIAKEVPKENKSPHALSGRYLRPWDLAPEILVVKAFALSVNQISDVISTDQGFYILQALDKREVKNMPSFAEAKHQIRDKLTAKYREELEESLMQQANVKIH